MKIAMIGQKGIPSRAGGIEIHVEEISKRLAKQGCDLEVYCRKGYCDAINSELDGVHIRYAPYIRTKHLDAITHTFFSTIKALVSGCDIFHYHALGPSTLSFIPRIFGKKVVCTVHGLDWQRGKWNGFASKYLKFGEYATARFSNVTINVSKNLVGYYKRKYDKDTVYIPNGVDIHQKTMPNVILNRYGLTKDSYILFLARLVPEKGAHYLVEAFKKLDTDKKLVIAGGSSHSDDYIRSLQEQLKDSERIIFTGFVKGEELAELYSNAYLYILPSDIEGLPISLLEAMSFGNCCLTSDIPENSNVLGEYGYLFKKGDVDDLRAMLNELLKEGQKVQQVRERVQDFVRSNYNWDEIADHTFSVYKDVLKQ